MAPANTDIAIIIPCYNEAATIGSVIKGLRKARSDLSIYVYDNNSTDETVYPNSPRIAGHRADSLRWYFKPAVNSSRNDSGWINCF